jgi:uncharacterized Zn finger protein
LGPPHRPRVRLATDDDRRCTGEGKHAAALFRSGYNYWRIAETYRKANRHDQALAWAEKGLKAFPEHTDSRLREFAAEEYHRRKRHEDAVQLMWTAFLEQPYLEAYQTLKKHAAKAGSWPQWRERALTEIKPQYRPGKREGTPPARRTLGTCPCGSLTPRADFPL